MLTHTVNTKGGVICKRCNNYYFPLVHIGYILVLTSSLGASLGATGRVKMLQHVVCSGEDLCVFALALQSARGFPSVLWPVTYLQGISYQV